MKERRRDLFLRKVQEDRDDRRWASRGDQVDNPWSTLASLKFY